VKGDSYAGEDRGPSPGPLHRFLVRGPRMGESTVALAPCAPKSKSNLNKLPACPTRRAAPKSSFALSRAFAFGACALTRDPCATVNTWPLRCKTQYAVSGLAQYALSASLCINALSVLLPDRLGELQKTRGKEGRDEKRESARPEEPSPSKNFPHCSTFPGCGSGQAARLLRWAYSPEGVPLKHSKRRFERSGNAFTASGLNCVIWCLLSSAFSFYTSSARFTRISFALQSLLAQKRARPEMGREDEEGNEEKELARQTRRKHRES
jgi:hypothetical protein